MIGKMKGPVIAGIERFMERRIPELSQFSISWFGGEPLMAENIVLGLAAHANRLCEDQASPSGGHVWLGHDEDVAHEVTRFVASIAN